MKAHAKKLDISFHATKGKEKKKDQTGSDPNRPSPANFGPLMILLGRVMFWYWAKKAKPFRFRFSSKN